MVAKETVKNLVEVRATLEDGDWVKPSDGEIDFKNGKVIVTPNKGGAAGSDGYCSRTRADQQSENEINHHGQPGRISEF